MYSVYVEGGSESALCFPPGKMEGVEKKGNQLCSSSTGDGGGGGGGGRGSSLMTEQIYSPSTPRPFTLLSGFSQRK